MDETETKRVLDKSADIDRLIFTACEEVLMSVIDHGRLIVQLEASKTVIVGGVISICCSLSKRC